MESVDHDIQDKTPGGEEVQEAIRLTGFQDADNISFFGGKGAEKIMERLDDLKSSSVMMIETDDVSDFGALGLQLLEGTFEGNPYVYFDEDDDDGRERPHYQLAVLDSKNISEIDEVAGYMTCLVKETISKKSLLVRLPVSQVAEMSPAKIEDANQAKSGLEKLKTETDASTMTVRETNQHQLERDRIVLGLWNYWAENDGVEDITNMLRGVYPEQNFENSLPRIEMFVADETVWNSERAGETMWNAKEVLDGLKDFTETKNTISAEDETKICLILELVSEKVVATPEIVWKMVKPVIDNLMQRGSDLEKVKYTLGMLELNTRINEVATYQKAFNLKEDEVKE